MYKLYQNKANIPKHLQVHVSVCTQTKIKSEFSPKFVLLFKGATWKGYSYILKWCCLLLNTFLALIFEVVIGETLQFTNESPPHYLRDTGHSSVVIIPSPPFSSYFLLPSHSWATCCCWQRSRGSRKGHCNLQRCLGDRGAFLSVH